MFLLTLFSCSLEPEIGSTITNYPIMELNGDETVFVPLGSTYNDPGVTATENGVEIQYTSKSIGDYRKGTKLDTNVSDQYTQSYTATNKDGFSNTITRTVIVYKNGDLVNSIEGLYTSTVARNGSTPSDAYRNMEYILIWKNNDGTYEISDSFGGWYQYGRAIGITSITPGGTMKAVDISANTFTFPGNPLTNTYFGGVANLTSVIVTPSTKNVVVSCDWLAPTAYKFVSTLTQVQL